MNVTARVLIELRVMPPLVSVILPFYNAERTLDAAISSIVHQTHAEWELLLVNNNSKDAGSSVAAGWAQNDHRITFLNEPKQGVAFAMNKGIEHAQGQFIARMDADDLTHPERLGKQLEFLHNHPDVDVIATQVVFTSELEHHQGFLKFVEWQNELVTHEQMFQKRFVDASLAQATSLIRLSAFERFGVYDTSNVPDDFELWLRWFHEGAVFAKLSQVLYTWQDGLARLSRSHPDYSTEAFDEVKALWLAAFLKRDHLKKGVVCLGTSKLCQQRADRLKAHGIDIIAFSDVSGKPAPGHAFIPPEQLKPGIGGFVVSLISQRGAGKKIEAFLLGQGLIEGQDFILAA